MNLRPERTVPEWFERSIGTAYDTCCVEVAGCSIHYLRWGDAKSPGLLLPPAIEIQTDYVLDHIARHSVREVEGGWTWKFDSALASVASLGLELKDVLRDLPCHSAAIYGENTHLADDTLLLRMTAITNGEVPVFVIPGSSHYPMIDSPLAFVSGVKGIALAWLAAARKSRCLDCKEYDC